MNNIKISSYVVCLGAEAFGGNGLGYIGLDSATTDCKFTATFGSQCSFCRFAS